MVRANKKPPTPKNNELSTHSNASVEGESEASKLEGSHPPLSETVEPPPSQSEKGPPQPPQSETAPPPLPQSETTTVTVPPIEENPYLREFPNKGRSSHATASGRKRKLEAIAGGVKEKGKKDKNGGEDDVNGDTVGGVEDKDKKKKGLRRKGNSENRKVVEQVQPQEVVASVHAVNEDPVAEKGIGDDVVGKTVAGVQLKAKKVKGKSKKEKSRKENLVQPVIEETPVNVEAVVSLQPVIEEVSMNVEPVLHEEQVGRVQHVSEELVVNEGPEVNVELVVRDDVLGDGAEVVETVKKVVEERVVEKVVEERVVEKVVEERVVVDVGNMVGHGDGGAEVLVATGLEGVGVELEGEDEAAEEGDEDKEEDEAAEEVDERQDSDVRVRVSEEVAKDGMYLSYQYHVAHRLIKDNVDRGTLFPKIATPYYNIWDLSKENTEVQNLVQACPLYGPLVCSYTSPNRVIISAMIERWHPETNTFHLPVGEMTITFDDVLRILGIPVAGKPLTSSFPVEQKKYEEFLVNNLGIGLEEVKAELARNGGKRVKFIWLKKQLAGRVGQRISGEAERYVTAEQVARGYLLVLIGCTLFNDKTGDKVSIKYLLYLTDLSKIGEWSWGSAMLARLYRHLGTASRYEVKQMSGYMTLLEAWVYEHIPGLRPNVVYPLEKGMYRTEQWVGKGRWSANQAKGDLNWRRLQLDNLQFRDVIWMPYRSVLDKPDDIVWWTGVIVDDKITEPYHPERVMRQFGYVQTRPFRPYSPKYCERTSAKKYTAVYRYRSEDFQRYKEHCICDESRGAQVSPLNVNECTAEYTEWYKCAKTRLNYTVTHSLRANVADNSGAAQLLRQVLEQIAKVRSNITSTTKPQIIVKLDEVLTFGGYKEGGSTSASPTPMKTKSGGKRKESSTNEVEEEANGKTKKTDGSKRQSTSKTNNQQKGKGKEKAPAKKTASKSGRKK